MYVSSTTTNNLQTVRYVTRDDLDGPHQKTLKEWQTTYSEALGSLKFTMELSHFVESNLGFMAK